MAADPFLVVGASLAGVRAAEALRRGGHDGPLVVVGEEPHRPYDRPPLSKQFLAGSVEASDVELDRSDSLDVDYRLGVRAEALDLGARTVRLSDGTSLAWGGLVLATGSRVRRLRLARQPGEGVYLLRTLDDARALRKVFDQGPRVAVVGAGFIGLEVAATARQRGLDVTVIELAATPLEQPLGPQLGGAVAELHRSNGVVLHTGVGVSELLGDHRVEGVRLSDGRVVEADVVVVGVGVAPATEWLAGSGVDLDNGVCCDSRCRVLAGGRVVPGVVAAGDLARWYHPTHGASVRLEHWTNAVEQAESAAAALLHGDAAEPYAPVPYFWSDQHGIKIQMVGLCRPGDEVRVVEGDPGEHRFVAAYGRDGKLVAALGMRRPARIMAYRRLIAEGAPFPPP